ncbi:retinitis pigmentosa GTPase regulator-like protein [Cryptosporidium ubiquitum]|uniref:Retinitis pigmentosa GTPase regulator-like protein n=1 Tax=Cryptosporidium ubiquitum TaxID=857276 RepID=A0A1J4MQV9_9CRYT|nr:retinitis pigmentosa GTPase regulator-like protein [Cryptosporidium ubiquitum]OII75277.1 retinitis pigmentosa GTPase regulator-like protein [Cryptosporidium ubiquitum]
MKLYILFFVFALSILLIGRPKIVESSSFVSIQGSPNKKSRSGIFGKLRDLFKRNKNKSKKVENETTTDSNYAKNDYGNFLDQSEAEDSEDSKTQYLDTNKDEASSGFSEGSLYPPEEPEIFPQDKDLGSEESKSAPPPALNQFSEESASFADSEQLKPQELISIYEDDYENNRIGEPGLHKDIKEESEKSKISEIEEEQKPSVYEKSVEQEESTKADVLGSLDSQIPEEISLQEGSAKSLHSLEKSKSDIIEDNEKENEESKKPKLDTTSGEENHYDASYDSNLEEIEKSISEYRDKFSENFSDELPHETYDRLLNEALNHESQSTLSSEKEKSLRDEENFGSERSESSSTIPKKETSEIEKYLEETANARMEESEASTADPEERETIDLNESSSKYASQGVTEEEPEDLEDYLVGVDIKVPMSSEHSVKSDIKSDHISTEYDREKTKSATSPLQEQEQELESEKESEQEFEEASKSAEESTQPSEKSTGFISRLSNSLRNFISSFGDSKKEPSVSVSKKEESIQVPFEETQKPIVESSEKEEIEESEELPDPNKSRVKMLIERFERENARNMPVPIGVPRNRLGLRDTERNTPKKNVDSLINFFEAEDIKAKEEAKRYQESKQKREMSRAESSVLQLQENPEEDLGEIQTENTKIEESPESGEEREAEIMRSINGEPSSELSNVGSETSVVSQNLDYDESQEELSLPLIIPSIDGQHELAGGLIWALGVGKYVCNSKTSPAKFIFPPLSSNVLVSAPNQEQITKLLQLSGSEVSEMIADLVSSVLNQN